ncbi:MAG TPA: DNA recombination/repair protein RecA, partial [Planctomycetaceae bacterium]|nr:DNA recombination/repair protein RecA [Planctomycetaceae bacterium]
SGAWFKYGEVYLGQGKEKARNFLIENPEVTEEIKQLVLATGGYAGPLSDGDGEESEEVEAEDAVNS